MTGRRLKYYWDSCVFIAHLKKETKKYPTEIPIIAELMAANSVADNLVVGSQIVKIEVLEWELSNEAKASFDAFFSQGDNLPWDVDGRVATIAREIRDYYKVNPFMVGKGEKKNPRGISTPDAIHLATAILHKVDEFHTLDGGGQDGFSLLRIGENVAGKYPLTICKPRRQLQEKKPEQREEAPDLFDQLEHPGESN